MTFAMMIARMLLRNSGSHLALQDLFYRLVIT
jgi:hypothetical protein